MGNDDAAEVGKIHRRLNDARVPAKRPNGLRLRTHERVSLLVEERDELSAELARIVSALAAIAEE
jgi:hypothetical protein